MIKSDLVGAPERATEYYRELYDPIQRAVQTQYLPWSEKNYRIDSRYFYMYGADSMLARSHVFDTFFAAMIKGFSGIETVDTLLYPHAGVDFRFAKSVRPGHVLSSDVVHPFGDWKGSGSIELAIRELVNSLISRSYHSHYANWGFTSTATSLALLNVSTESLMIHEINQEKVVYSFTCGDGTRMDYTTYIGWTPHPYLLVNGLVSDEIYREIAESARGTCIAISKAGGIKNAADHESISYALYPYMPYLLDGTVVFVDDKRAEDLLRSRLSDAELLELHNDTFFAALETINANMDTSKTLSFGYSDDFKNVRLWKLLRKAKKNP